MQCPNIDYLKRLAEAAGELMMEGFNKEGEEVARKDDNTIVTETDILINQLVLEKLREDFPNISVYGEEGSREVKGSKYKIFFDPIDGTIPYVIGLPISSFCISVVFDMRPKLSVIYDPFLRRMWSAVRGEGAFLNGDKIEVSKVSNIEESALAFYWWDNDQVLMPHVLRRLIVSGANWINPASAAIAGALIANGRLEASVFPGSNCWETVAIQLLVEEAGGRVSDLYGHEILYSTGRKIRGHVISNGRIHDQLLSYCSQA